MAKATSLWNQLTGCFNLNRNFILYIMDNNSKRRVDSVQSEDKFLYMGSVQITLQPIVATEEFSSPAHLDNISPPWSSFYASDHLGLALWIFLSNKKQNIKHLHVYSPKHHYRSPEWYQLGWLFYASVGVKTFNLAISRYWFAEYGRQTLNTHAARAARLFFLFKPITFWLIAVVFAIGVVLAKAPC